jgi:hypothetical protein
MARAKLDLNKRVIIPNKKKSSGSGNDAMVKTSSMNKSKKRSYKKYRGQGR